MRAHAAGLAIATLCFAVSAGAEAGDSGAAAATPSSRKIEAVSVDGTVLKVRLSDGSTLAGADLKGATLTLAASGKTTPLRVRIDDVVPDPTDPDHEVLLYRMKAIDAGTGELSDLCGPDANGDHWALPVQGQWDPNGVHVSNSGYTLTCGDAAQGKCVRFGYKPWKTLADGTSLADYHQACVRLIRADYCGNRGTTRDGMRIDIYDSIGILRADERPEALGMRFEAAWGPEGAVCVAHTRVPENETLQQLATDCPRLSQRLGPENCTPERAKGYGKPVLLYNRSF